MITGQLRVPIANFPASSKVNCIHHCTLKSVDTRVQMRSSWDFAHGSCLWCERSVSAQTSAESTSSDHCYLCTAPKQNILEQRSQGNSPFRRDVFAHPTVSPAYATYQQKHRRFRFHLLCWKWARFYWGADARGCRLSWVYLQGFPALDDLIIPSVQCVMRLRLLGMGLFDQGLGCFYETWVSGRQSVRLIIVRFTIRIKHLLGARHCLPLELQSFAVVNESAERLLRRKLPIFINVLWLGLRLTFITSKQVPSFFSV